MFAFFCTAFIASWAAAYHFMLPKTSPEAHGQPITPDQPKSMQEVLDTFKGKKIPPLTPPDSRHFSQVISHASIDRVTVIKAFHIAATLLPIGFIVALLQLEEFAILDQKRLPLFMLPIFLGICAATIIWRLFLHVFILADDRKTIMKHFMSWGIIGWLSLGLIGSYIANFDLDTSPTRNVSGVITSITCRYHCSTREPWSWPSRLRSSKRHTDYIETSLRCFTAENRARVLQEKPGSLQRCTRDISIDKADVTLRLHNAPLETLYNIDDEALTALNGALYITIEEHPGYLGVPWTSNRSIKAAY